MSLEKYLSYLYDGTFKGFNLIFGNVLDQIVGNGKRTNGNLRHYQDQNLPPNCKLFKAPKILITGFSHGLSNGDLNQWHKVLKGRKAFFDEFIKSEKEVREVPEGELSKFMDQYSQTLQRVVMTNSQLQDRDKI